MGTTVQNILQATFIILIPTLLAVGGIVWGFVKDKEFKRRKNEMEIEKKLLQENINLFQKELFFTLREMKNYSRQTVFWVKFWSIYTLICIGLAIILWIIYIFTL